MSTLNCTATPMMRQGAADTDPTQTPAFQENSDPPVEKAATPRALGPYDLTEDERIMLGDDMRLSLRDGPVLEDRPFLVALKKAEKSAPGLHYDVKKKAMGRGSMLAPLESALKEICLDPSGEVGATHPDGQADTLENALTRARHRYVFNNQAPDYRNVGRAGADWLEEHGAKPLSDETRKTFLYYNKRMYVISGGDYADRDEFGRFLLREANLMSERQTDRLIIRALTSELCDRAKRVKRHAWRFTDVKNLAVYVHLNDPEKDTIVRITARGVEEIPNGVNDYGVWLEPSGDMEPIKYQRGVRWGDIKGAVTDYFFNALSCSAEDKMFIWCWTLTHALVDFAPEIRPSFRAEGPPASGKTTAGDLITALLRGEPHTSNYTVAAASEDAARFPVIVWDNLERQRMKDPAVSDFFLHAITGAAKKKRQRDTDNGVITERPKGLIATNGCYPITGEDAAQQSRVFVVRFTEDFMKPGFLAVEALKGLADYRNAIMSYSFDVAARVLAIIEGQRGLSRAKLLIDETLGRHSKWRANPFWARMYLITLSEHDSAGVEEGLERLNEGFGRWLSDQDRDATASAIEADPVVVALQALVSQRVQYYGADGGTRFRERYHIDMDPDGSIRRTSMGDLYRAMAAVTRGNMRLPFDGPRGLQGHCENNRLTIQAAGFYLMPQGKTNGVTRYELAHIPRGDDTDQSPSMAPEADDATPTKQAWLQ